MPNSYTRTLVDDGWYVIDSKAGWNFGEPQKTLKQFLLPVLEPFDFAWQAIRYTLIFVSAFFRQRTSLACEMVAIRSQLTFYKENIRQKRQPRPRFHPAFLLLWVLLSSVWAGWRSALGVSEPLPE